MKKLILLFVFFTTIRAMSTEDSCLALMNPNCITLGYNNIDSVLTDTCSGKNEYYARIYRLNFIEYVFNLMDTSGNKTIFSFIEIDSIWQNLPSRFNDMKNLFKMAHIRYGNYFLEKVYPYETDTTFLKYYYVKFEKYYSVSEIESFFKSIYNISECYLKLSPGPMYFESYQFSIYIEINNFYPKLHISNYFPYTSWCEDSLDIEIFRKSRHDKDFSLLKKITLKK